MATELILYFGVISASLLCALALVVGSFIMEHFPNSKITKWLEEN